MNNKNFSRGALAADINDGNAADQFLGHLVESELSDEAIKEALALMAEAAADRKDKEAIITSKSTRGVEHLTGGVDFEKNHAAGLRKLADWFRNNL